MDIRNFFGTKKPTTTTTSTATLKENIDDITKEKTKSPMKNEADSITKTKAKSPAKSKSPMKDVLDTIPKTKSPVNMKSTIGMESHDSLPMESELLDSDNEECPKDVPSTSSRLSKNTNSAAKLPNSTPRKRTISDDISPDLKKLKAADNVPESVVSTSSKSISSPSKSDSMNKLKQKEIEPMNEITKSSSPSKRHSESSEKDNIESQSKKKKQVKALISNGFEGLKFVITGEMRFPPISRDEMTDMIASIGGKVNGNVSSKTDFLIYGVKLEDGREIQEGNKYKTAIEKEISMLSQEEFKEMFQIAMSQYKSPVVELPLPIKPTFSSSSSSSIVMQQQVEAYDSNDYLMWVDKYKPSSIDEIIGNTGLVKKLIDWIANWDNVHIRKTIKIPYSKENPGAKMVLLSGPPGIGKTTMATIVARHLGFETLELNASDTRSKNSISEHLRDVVGSTSLTSSGQSSLKKRVIIMDEVDGMSGNSDRGGLSELIAISKLSKNPIICICNDRNKPSLKSFVNHCYDLKVARPIKNQIAMRMVEIARKEGLAIEPYAAEILVEQTGNDIRQVLHSMQMMRSGSTYMNSSDIRSSITTIAKDKILRQSPFEACQSILLGSSHGNMTEQERYNSFFIDYSLVPLLIQQNYIESVKTGIFRSQLSDCDKMDMLAKAADSVSDINLIEAKVSGMDGHWELLPSVAMMCVRTGSLTKGGLFPSFPAWFGKNSSTSKKARLVRELVHHTALTVNQNFQSMRLEYIPYLRTRLLKAFQQSQGDANGITNLMEILDSYGLSRDDFMDSMQELQFIREKDAELKDHYEGIDSKLKAQFTRAYNSSSHSSQALVASLDVSKKKASRILDEELEMDIDDGAPIIKDADEEDEIDLSKFQKKSKVANTTKASATSSKTKSKSSKK